MTGRRRRSPWVRRIKLAIVFLVIALLSGFCLVFGMFLSAEKAAEAQMSTLEAKFEQVSRPASRILSADGVELFRESPENRIPLKLSQIPVRVRQAIIAAEDKRFYEHNGVDSQGLLRAVWNLIRDHHVAGGGSTITMQLAKRLYNGNAVTFHRKLDDIAFAVAIENTIANKNRILELYLNQVYFGEGAYGIGAAARIYLNKSISDLSISDSALLARCVRIPNRENPIRSFKVAMQNRDVVLQIMRDEKMITEDEYQKALDEQPKINKHPQRTTALYTAGYGQYFVRHVLETLEQDAPGIDFKSGGITVYTTVDSRLQRLAEHTVRRVVAENRQNRTNQGAFVAMDRDGHILCEVGGTDFTRSQWNIITQSHLQPGSGFKPILYATALREGVVHMGDYLSNAPISIKDGDHFYEPKNASPRENAPSYSLASAIALSINRPAVHTILKVTPQTVVQYAHDYFGFRSNSSQMHAYPSLAIGACEVTPLEMLEAYSVFMLRGDRVRPQPITKIVGPDGQIIKEFYSQRFPGVFDPVVCDEMDQLLQGVVQRGTGTAASDIPDARGKTGTTNDAKDAWFNGYTDGVVGVAWVGNERLVKGRWKQLPMASAVFGGTTAVYIWHDVMAKARELYGEKPAPPAPSGVEVAAKPKQKPVDSTPAPDAVPPMGDTATAGAAAAGAETDPGGATSPPGTGTAATGTAASGPAGAAGQAANMTPVAAKPLPAAPTDTIAPRRDAGSPPADQDLDNPAPKPKAEAPAKPKPKRTDTVTVEVCADTGDLATPYCPETVSRTYPAGKQPRKYCTLHRSPHG